MRKFNTTGVCIPEKHYMADVSKKIREIEKMVEAGKYFIISKPHQTGKTTILYLLRKSLEKMNYIVINITFEDFDQNIFSSTSDFCREFVLTIRDRLKFNGDTELVNLLEKEVDNIDDFLNLSYLITNLIEKSEKRVVLIIDDVDKGYINQLFFDFLEMLQAKFNLAQAERVKTFHSIILAGMHNINDIMINDSSNEIIYNSIWNIASEFNIDFELEIKEIASMLREYSAERNIELNADEFAEKLYYYTSGHPFLVSKLVEVIDDEIIQDNENRWQEKYLDQAVELILNRKLLHFDILIKNMGKVIELEEMCEKIVIDGRIINYAIVNSVIKQGKTYGLFKKQNGIIKIHNKIYKQRLLNYLVCRKAYS
ncbi:AAA-like domain-containing protein [Halanaerobium saccharolyticum]|uniref:AAA-like domain-containing protein n=1 Tax=Halanaerobium saccharolyticum TaxID=43595 RepID=UPI003FCCCCA5